MKEKAYFVFRPRTAADLCLSNPTGKWREYRIVKTIRLNALDYENFTTDLLADRQFIGDFAPLCTEEHSCLLITGRRQADELLVIPWRGCFVRCAALRPGIRIVPASEP